MARLALNKASLAKQKQDLDTYVRFLPSLDLKRRQLMAQRARAAAELKTASERIAELDTAVGKLVPMLANDGIELTGLVAFDSVEISDENVMGVHLPKLDKLNVSIADYGALVKPHWVDRVVDLIREAMELRVHRQIAERRVAVLDAAVRKVTQRVNLFEKVLIPRAKKNIRYIQIYLSDMERAAVVASKISKGKQAAAAAA